MEVWLRCRFCTKRFFLYKALCEHELEHVPKEERDSGVRLQALYK